MVLLGAAATMALKAAGPVLLGAHPLPAAATRVMPLLAPGLLSALVVANTFTAGRHLVVDSRSAGLLVAAGCIALRAPVLVTVIAAAAVTATLRALTH